jgi:hypothetical protein
MFSPVLPEMTTAHVHPLNACIGPFRMQSVKFARDWQTYPLPRHQRSLSLALSF